MDIKTDASFIKAVWTGLNKPTPTHRDERMVASYVERIAASGWAFGADIEDFPTYLDGRLDPIHDVPYRDLVDTFDLPLRNVHGQPRRGEDESWGFSALAAPDFASLLIELERLGFLMDPEPLVKAIRPTLLTKTQVTWQERQVILYEKQRHRMAPICLHAQPTGGFRDLLEQKMTTSAGYKVSMHSTDLGEPVSLEVRAPKYRRARADA